jgi:hypothetical protein
MPLRILKANDPLTVEHLIATVYAAPGLGKTSLGYTAEKPLLLDFDNGAYRSANRGDTVQVKSWADVASISKEDLSAYKTLVIDTAGRALDHLATDIIANNPKMGRSGALTLQGFGELKAKFIAYTKLVRSFGLDIVLLVHADEQKSGDDIIERLDAQGGSKNEIYKVSDLMGRLKIESGKRMLNFSPTDTAFGKNPADFPKLEVPNFATTPHFLAKVMADTKTALNRQTEAQAKVAKELADWGAKFGDAANASDFNKLAAEVKEKASADARDNAGRLLTKVAKEKGFALDKETKKFVQAAERVAA